MEDASTLHFTLSHSDADKCGEMKTNRLWTRVSKSLIIYCLIPFLHLCACDIQGLGDQTKLIPNVAWLRGYRGWHTMTNDVSQKITI